MNLESYIINKIKSKLIKSVFFSVKIIFNKYKIFVNCYAYNTFNLINLSMEYNIGNILFYNKIRLNLYNT